MQETENDLRFRHIESFQTYVSSEYDNITHSDDNIGLEGLSVPCS